MYRLALCSLGLALTEAVNITIQNEAFVADFGQDDTSPQTFGQLLGYKSVHSTQSIINTPPLEYFGPWGARITTKGSTSIVQIGAGNCTSRKIVESSPTSVSFLWEDCFGGLAFSLSSVLTNVGVELYPGLSASDASTFVVDYQLSMPMVITPSTLNVPGDSFLGSMQGMRQNGLVITYLNKEMSNWEGFYFAPHHPTYFAKEVLSKNGIVTHRIIYPAEKNGGKLNYTQSWPFLLTAFNGESWDGYQIYRNWAIKNANWASTPLVSRTDIADYVYNFTFFLCTNWQAGYVRYDYGAGDPSAVEYYIQDLADRINLKDGAQLGVHWYTWDLLGFTAGSNATKCDPNGDGNKLGCGFDTHYPQFLPARNRFKEVVATLRNRNIHVAPYTNGRLFDNGLNKYTSEGAERYATKETDANEYKLSVGHENWHSRPQSIMCPGTSYWQSVITDYVFKLMNDYGLPGVYVDQLGAAAPVACRDPTHNHTVGGGDYWNEGYRKVMRTISAGVNEKRKHFRMSEGCFEGMMGTDGVDVHLCHNRDQKVIYSGHFFATGGAGLIAGTDPHNFAHMIGEQFVIGSIMGWTPLYGNIGTMDVYLKNPDVVHYIQVLSSAKIASREWFSFGQLLRPVAFASAPSGDLSSSCFLHPSNGSVLCSFCNGGLNTSVEINISLKPEKYLLSSTTSHQISYLNGTVIKTTSPGQSIDFIASLPGLSVIQIVIL